MAVVPAESGGEDRSLIAFFKDEPFFLPDAGVGVVTPEIDAQQLVMSKPDRAVVVVVGGSGMSHAGQSFTGRAVEREEKRSRILTSVMPAGSFRAVDPD